MNGHAAVLSRAAAPTSPTSSTQLRREAAAAAAKKALELLSSVELGTKPAPGIRDPALPISAASLHRKELAKTGVDSGDGDAFGIPVRDTLASLRRKEVNGHAARAARSSTATLTPPKGKLSLKRAPGIRDPPLPLSAASAHRQTGEIIFQRLGLPSALHSSAKPAFGPIVRDTLSSKKRVESSGKMKQLARSVVVAAAAAAAANSIGVLPPSHCCNYFCWKIREKAGRGPRRRRHDKMLRTPPFHGLSTHEIDTARKAWRAAHGGRFRFRPGDKSSGRSAYDRVGGPPHPGYTAAGVHGTKKFDLRLKRQRGEGQRWSDAILVCGACFRATELAAGYQEEMAAVAATKASRVRERKNRAVRERRRRRRETDDMRESSK